jgi:hypothetical protein
MVGFFLLVWIPGLAFSLALPFIAAVFSQPPTNRLVLWVVGFVVTIGIGLGASVFLKARARRSAGQLVAQPLAPGQEATVSVRSKPMSVTPPRGMKFCLFCGQPIPLRARFCTNTNCGRPQE